MLEFKVGEHEYIAKPMPVVVQFHVLRRLATVLRVLPDIVPLLPVIQRLRTSAPTVGEGEEVTTAEQPAVSQADLAKVAVPLADAIAALSDKDSEYVLGACLGHCQRRDGSRFMPIWNQETSRAMFKDIELVEMLQIAAYAMRVNFARFFAAIPSASPAR